MDFPKLKPLWLIRLTVLTVVVGVAILVGYRFPHVLKNVQNIFLSGASFQKETWSLERDTVYRGCGHHLYESKEYASEKELRDFLAKDSEQKLLHDQGSLIKVRRNVEDYCKTCKDHQFLGVKANKVVVRMGTPDQPGPVIQTIDINIELLPPVEREDLKKGISFKGDKEKLQLIEGLNGLIVN